MLRTSASVRGSSVRPVKGSFDWTAGRRPEAPLLYVCRTFPYIVTVRVKRPLLALMLAGTTIPAKGWASKDRLTDAPAALHPNESVPALTVRV
jgi:hypothetical protein